MPAPTNLGFETAGAGAGRPANWALRSNASTTTKNGRLYAGFVPSDAANTFGTIAAPNDLTSGGTWFTAGATATANSATAPDGSTTASTLTETTANSTHLAGVLNLTPAAGQTTTFGAFLKAGTVAFAGVVLTGPASTVVVDVNLSTGLVEFVSAPNADFSALSAETILLPNGWLLLSVSFTPVASSNVSPEIAIFNDNAGTYSYTGTSRTLFVWGAYKHAGDLLAVNDFEGGWGIDGYLFHTYNTAHELGAVWNDGSTVLRPAETFEAGWLFTVPGPSGPVTKSNNPFLVHLAAEQLYVASDGSGNSFENFENANNGWFSPAFTFNIGSKVPMSVQGGAGFEGFEANWSNNAFSYHITTSVVGTFVDGAAQNFENFEAVRRDRVFTAAAASVTLTSTAHGYSLNDAVTVSSTFALPTGLKPNVRYFVNNPTANTFELAATLGGPSITMSDAGVQVHTLRGDPAFFWNETNVNQTI